MPMLQNWRKHVKHWLTRPRAELSRYQRTVRYIADVARFCARELGQDRATQMAAALTYRTIFSLIPMAVLAVLVFRALGGFENMGTQVQDKIYHYLGLSSIAMEQQSSEQGETLTTDEQSQVRSNISSIIDDLTAKASGVSFGSIGTVGLALFIWAAIALVVTVEQFFNQIYCSPTGRPWHHRITIYWAIITLGPVLLAVSLYVAGQIADNASAVPMLGPLLGFFSRFTALGASWLLLFLLYMLMPNTSVQLRPAAIGSFVAAVLWEIGKWGFQLYVKNAVGVSTVYGSLGVVPLFLFWLYLTWLIVLFGLEVSYTLQMMSRKDLEDLETEDRAEQLPGDPHWLLPVMTAVGKSFVAGKAIVVNELARELKLSSRRITVIMNKLTEAGLVHQVHADKEVEPGYTLALPPQQLLVRRILEVGRSLSAGGSDPQSAPGGQWLAKLLAAEDKVAGDTTLASVIDSDNSRSKN